MKIDVIFAPWRYKYIKQISRKEQSECIFCEAVKKNDEEALILLRGRYSYVIMNLYPYNTGHVMVVPYRHIESIIHLSESEAREIFTMIKISLLSLRDALSPHGFNIGINIGKIAGAGVEDHVHIHIVPRWSGDTNFMPIISGVKVIPQDVRETYKYLKPFFIKTYKSVIENNNTI